MGAKNINENGMDTTFDDMDLDIDEAVDFGDTGDAGNNGAGNTGGTGSAGGDVVSTDKASSGAGNDKPRKPPVKPNMNKGQPRRNIVQAQSNSENPVQKPVKPSSNNGAAPAKPSGAGNSARSTPLVEISNEQFAYDDFNSAVVEDEVIAEMDKKDEQEEAKKEKNAKAKTKLKKILPFAILGLAVVVAGAVGIKVATSDKGVNFVEVNVAEYVSTKEKPKIVDAAISDNAEKGELVDTDETGETGEVAHGGVSAVKDPVALISGEDAQDIGKYKKYDITVNAKVDGSESYENYDTAMYVGMTNVAIGYDNVKSFIDDYNSKSSTKMTVDESKFDDDITLVAIEADLQFREDYPVNLGSDKVYDLPTLDISLTGTYVNENDEQDYSDYLVVEENGEMVAYNMPSVTNLYIAPESVSCTEGYKYVWIAQLPKGLLGSNYNINMNINYKNDEQTVVYSGKDVK